MSSDTHRKGQIALPLPPAQAGIDPRIIVGNANEAAIEALAYTDEWPYGTAILFGPPRSGKSLLARWFEGQGGGDVVDDADRMDETELFHRWNRARESGTPLLLTATTREEGQDWDVALPDLRSRLRPALRLDIGEPDDAMMAELMAVHAEARALALGDDAFAYLATRAERSHLMAERIVAAIDRISLERKCAPGPAVWREALAQVQGGNATGQE